MKLGSLHDPVLDDVRDFKVCDEAMTKMGVSDADKMTIFMLVAAVLHLGNITFEDNHDDAKGQYMSVACALMQYGYEEVLGQFLMAHHSLGTGVPSSTCALLVS